MEFITFDEMIESGKATKQQKQLLNFERFGLLPEDVASAVTEERELGNFPRPLVPVSQEEFDTYKDFMKDLSKTGFMGDIQDFSDEDFAKLFYTLDRTQNFFTDSDVYKEVGAIAGGITGAQVLNSPGVTGNLNSKLSKIVTKFPRIGRMIGAFIGGAGGSTPGVAASDNSISDKFKEVIGFGAREAAGEGAFQLLAKLFGGRFRKLFTGKEGQALEAGAKSSQKILTEAGATLTPARLSKNTTIDMIEQLAEVSFFGGQGIREAGEKAVDVSQELLGKYLNDIYYPGTAQSNFVKNFSKKASFENVDDLMKNFLLKGQDFYDTAVTASYKNLNKVTKSLIGNNKIVDSKAILAAFDNKVRLSKGQLEAADPTVLALRNYILNISEKGKGGIDFVTAKNMRTYFLQKKTKNYTAAGTSPTTYVQGLAGDMAKFTSQLIGKSVKAQVNSGKLTKEQSTQLLNAYKSSSKLYAEEQSTFNTKFISQLLLDEADGPVTKTSLDTADMIYRSVIGTGDKPGRVREFFRLIDNATKKIGPEGKSILTKEGADIIRQKMQGQFFNDILKTVSKDGIIDAKAVIEFTSGRKGPGERVLKELFKGNTSTLKNMEKYLNAMVLAQSKGIEKQKGSLAFISGQFGAAGTVLALGRGSVVAVGTALSILGGPKIISKLFADPKFVDNLLKIQTTPSGTSAYGRSFVQLLNNLVANQAVDPILAKRFVDEAVIEDIFPDPEEAKSQMKWYKKIDDSDLTSEENDNPAILDLQAKFNQSPPGLLEQLGIKTLDSEPTTQTAMNLAPPSMSGLNLPSLGGSSSQESINPNTLASLDAVGMPLFQAKDGGLASLKNFKKPQVVS